MVAEQFRIWSVRLSSYPAHLGAAPLHNTASEDRCRCPEQKRCASVISEQEVRTPFPSDGIVRRYQGLVRSHISSSEPGILDMRCLVDDHQFDINCNVGY